MLQAQVSQEWLSYPGAERYSGLSHMALWRHVESGELEAAKVRRSVRRATTRRGTPPGPQTVLGEPGRHADRRLRMRSARGAYEPEERGCVC